MARYIELAVIHFQVSERGDNHPDIALEQFREAEKKLTGTYPDLIVTCEGMEAVGQTMSQAEDISHPGTLLKAYRDCALKNHCTVAGSVKLKNQRKIYNTLVFIGPDGEVLGDYRKTFPTSREIAEGIVPGSGAKVIETPAGRLGGIICFDLNFNELLTDYCRLKPDILCFSSMFHGGIMQRNWAYQCRCFLASADKDNSSDIVDPLGRVISSANYYSRVGRARINIDRFVMHQDGNMDHFPDIRRKYGSQVFIDADPQLGAAVLYSQSHDFNAQDIADEFGLVEIEKYLHENRHNRERSLKNKKLI